MVSRPLGVFVTFVAFCTSASWSPQHLTRKQQECVAFLFYLSVGFLSPGSFSHPPGSPQSSVPSPAGTGAEQPHLYALGLKFQTLFLPAAYFQWFSWSLDFLSESRKYLSSLHDHQALPPNSDALSFNLFH